MSTNLSQIKLDKQDQIIALIAILFIVGCVFFYNSLYAPKVQEVEAAKAELQLKVDEYNRMKATAEQFDELDRKVKEAQLSLAAFEKKVPIEEEIPSLLVKLQESALNAGLDIQAVTKGKLELLADENSSAQTPNSVQPTTTSIQGIVYSKFPITLTVDGSFVEFVKFMKELEDMERFVTVKTVTIAPKEDDKLTVNFEMNAFVQGKGGDGL